MVRPGVLRFGDFGDFGRMERRGVGFTWGEPRGFVVVSGRISLIESFSGESRGGVGGAVVAPIVPWNLSGRLVGWGAGRIWFLRERVSVLNPLGGVRSSLDPRGKIRLTMLVRGTTG